MRALCAFAACLLSSSSLAFESQCRDPQVAATFGGRHNLIAAAQASSCAFPAAECTYGLDAARGELLGEHTWITLRGMQLSGLGTYLTSSDTLRYYTDGMSVAYANVPSLAPAGTGATKKRVDRPMYLPEFAQIPDVAYSMSDFLLGNEHCIEPRALPRDQQIDISRINACHTFRSHMGAVNSTHFLPQTRHMYRLYHDIALAIASRCKQMKEAWALAGNNFPLAARRDDYLMACEREAMAFQSIASHYQADGWSSGHMWERWGSPMFAEDENQRVNQIVVAMVSGIIHGWRSVVRGVPIIGAVHHDQMCEPGPASYRVDLSGDGVVRWAEPGGNVHPGGGDLYLLPCTASNPTWAVASVDVLARPHAPETVQMSVQYRRMMGCIVKGFREVYEAGSGAIAETQWSPEPVELPSSSNDETCWSQRATNESMALGARAGNILLDEPSVVARLLLPTLPLVATKISQREPDVGHLIYQFTIGIQKEWVLLNLELARLKSNAANGTAAANLATNRLRTFMGVERNSAYAHLIDSDQVPYLERRAQNGRLDGWSHAEQVKGNGLVDCADDRQCDIAAGEYCDRSVLAQRSDNTYGPSRRCVRHETAVLRAFRDAELPYWCLNERTETITQAREACRASPAPGPGGDSAECQACVELVLPRLRNACDAGADGFRPNALGVDRRSACDLLQAKGLFTRFSYFNALHHPFEPNAGETWEDATWRTARKLCREDVLELGAAMGYGYQSGPPEAATLQDDSPFESEWWYSATCGLSEKAHWWKYRHDAGAAHTHAYVVEAANIAGRGTRFNYVDPVDRLELTLFRGPDCLQDQNPIQGTLVTRPDGTQALQVAWQLNGGADVMCLRVRPRGATVRTGYRIREE